MTDLRELLDPIAGNPAPPTPDVVSSDVRRGRAALRRRRGLSAAAGLGLAAAVAVGVVVVPGLGGQPDPAGVVAGPASQGSPEANPGVDLVPWAQDAAAAKPIAPALVPDGWTVAGSEYALVISAPGVTTSVDDFRGKLVAGLSRDSTPSDTSEQVTVDGEVGTVSQEGDTTILLYPLADARQMSIQAPTALHWDTATLVRFAEALTVGADAPSSVG